MHTIQDWNGEAISACRSKGKSLAVVNPFENLLRSGVPLWPPPEVLQKLYESHHLRDFPEADHGDLQSHLGFYCDLQSIRSEDAITWSYFGPLIYATADVRLAFVASFLQKLRLPQQKAGFSEIWLWRRLMHPEKKNMGGPEIDFGIMTKDTVLLGETKWRTPEGKQQGLHKDRGQIELRLQLFDEHWRVFGEKRQFVVVALSLTGGLVKSQTRETAGRVIATRDITWNDVASLVEHPVQDEFTRYLEWKKKTDVW